MGAGKDEGGAAPKGLETEQRPDRSLRGFVGTWILVFKCMAFLGGFSSLLVPPGLNWCLPPTPPFFTKKKKLKLPRGRIYRNYFLNI